MWIFGGVLEAQEGEKEPCVVSDVWSSTDGRAWEYVGPAAWPPRWGHTSVVFDGKMWVLGGQGGAATPWSCLNDVWCSDDGLAWTLVTACAPWCPRTQHVSVVHQGKIWVIYGNGDHGQENDIWTTEDGIGWTCITDHRPWPGVLPYAAVQYQDKMWVFSSGMSFYDWDHDDVWTLEMGAEEGEGYLDTYLFHSADYQTAWHPGVIKLEELLRVIQFYNSGGYHCEACTEDDYAAEPGDTSCRPHDADYNPQDWHIGLSELLRVIQFYNSGAYCPCPGAGTEDGFCPGQAGSAM